MYTQATLVSASKHLELTALHPTPIHPLAHHADVHRRVLLRLIRAQSFHGQELSRKLHRHSGHQADLVREAHPRLGQLLHPRRVTSTQGEERVAPRRVAEARFPVGTRADPSCARTERQGLRESLRRAPGEPRLELRRRVDHIRCRPRQVAHATIVNVSTLSFISHTQCAHASS
jgi:hypothetical protein